MLYEDEPWSGAIKSLESILGCELLPHAIYEKNGKKYILIYAEYEESVCPDQELIQEIIKYDLEKIHNVLCPQIEGLDYVFYMPYYNYFNMDKKTRESVLFTPIESSYLIKADMPD